MNPKDSTPQIVSVDAVRAQLERVLASKGFVDAGRLGPFLKFLVEHALAGDTANLKESVLGVEVFQRQPGYSSSSDPIVRVEARRLRSRLDEYYRTAGKQDQIIFQLPKGAYVPVFGRPVEAAGGYQTPKRRQLFMLGLCALGLIIVWGAYWSLNKPSPDAPAGQAAASLVVLPFTNLSPDPDNEYFSAGLTTELTDALTKIDGLRVVALSSTPQPKGQDAREIGKRFHTSAVLEGSVRKSGDRLRVTAQVADSATGFQIWSQTYERQLKDVFAIQEEIARAIVNALRVQLKVDPNRKLARQPTQNLDAYNLYLRGRYHFSNPRSEDDLRTGVVYLERAIQIEPNFAAAYAALSNINVMLGYYQVVPAAEAWPKAKREALKAIAIDSSLAEAHAALGFANAMGDWDWAASEREFRRALELNPGSADTHNSYAIAYLTPTGHLDAARNESKLGVSLDPLAFFPNYGAAFILLASRQYDAAIAQYRTALDLNSSIADVWWDLGMAYGFAGKAKDAMEQFQHAGKMREGSGWNPGIAELALLGRMDEAKVKAQAFKRSPPKLRAVDAARSFALVGDRAAAFAYLEKAFQERDTQLIWLKIDPRFDNLRSDARFPLMLKRLSLD